MTQKIDLVVNAFTTHFMLNGQTVLIADTATLTRELEQAMLLCRHKDGAGKSVHLTLEAYQPLGAA